MLRSGAVVGNNLQSVALAHKNGSKYNPLRDHHKASVSARVA